jgi:hypothetical protein
MIRERPILFSAPMVRALLAGTKTQTRRIAQPKRSIEPMTDECPYGQPGGDRLWVRESWRADAAYDAMPPRDIPAGSQVWYEADTGLPGLRGLVRQGKLRPGMFMPRWASRITLEVTEVRVERLQDISEADALAEGIVPGYGGFGLPDGSHFHAADPRESYFSLWEAINGRASVEANPWVWAVSFRRTA